MCGIVGFVQPSQDISTISKMLEVQKYRGPDDTGHYHDSQTGVHFGHNRLSIQDLSAHGHQPFISPCQNYILTFNGEVYNFQTIRQELEALGYCFISNSDTEVILYAYMAWGIGCLEKFIGMFAFSILDKITNQLFLVRDRAGVKPLYYYHHHETFLFASELKSFHQHPNFSKSINRTVLPYYFQFGYIPAPHTIFADCYKLQPGHYLIYDLTTQTTSLHPYWDVKDFYRQPLWNKSEAEILQDIEAILEDSLNLRMIADVPVGIFLSGGYDSSLVSAMLQKKLGKTINTFTIGFKDQRYNEAEHAKSIAEYLGTHHTEYYMEESDMLSRVNELPYYYDEPFGDASALPTIVVSQLARQKVTVALSADGGDEAFCGYSKYFFLNKFAPIFASPLKRKMMQTGLNLLNEKQIGRLNRTLPAAKQQTNIEHKFKKFKQTFRASSLEEMFQYGSSQSDPQFVTQLLSPSASHPAYPQFDNPDGFSLLNYMMAVDYQTFMNDDVLTKVDRATMSVSLEGREPLLDHRIIEYLARVPIELKYKNNQGKYLLRKILYQYLPQEMVDKPKSGFNVPLDRWLRHELRSLVEYYLDKERLDPTLFDIEVIERLKRDFFAQEEGNAMEIWLLLMYQMWYEWWMA